MKPTRPLTLLGIATACALVAWLIVAQAFASLPPLPWTAVPALLLLAIGEATAGRNLRARISGQRAARPLQPIAVAKMAALAKASSAAAAALGGLAAGFDLYVAGQLAKDVPRADAFAASATVLAAALLVGAALYLERCCRAPGPPRDAGSLTAGAETDWR